MVRPASVVTLCCQLRCHAGPTWPEAVGGSRGGSDHEVLAAYDSPFVINGMAFNFQTSPGKKWAISCTRDKQSWKPADGCKHGVQAVQRICVPESIFERGIHSTSSDSGDVV